MSADKTRDENGSFATTVTDEEIWAQYELTPSTQKVAHAFGLSTRTIRERLARIRHDKGLTVKTPSVDAAGALEKLLAAVPAQDPKTGAHVKEISVNLHESFMKDQFTQQPVKVGMDGVRAKYVLANTAPEFPLIQPANPTTFAYYSEPPRILRKIRRAVIISDAQIGRIWRDGIMVPTHDPLALEVAEQIVGDVEPDELDYIGDWMDWSMLSRWPKKPEYVNATQQGIQDGYDWHGRLISAAGHRCKRKRKVKGNHDDRPQIFLRDHNLEAMGLRRASDTTGWPVFSTEFLLRYDELGIEVSEPYPNGTVWLTDDLMLTHAPPKKLEIAASVIHGHLHKLTRTTWAQTNRDGRLTYFLYDIGCLCKIDGSVPSDRARTDWAQGIAVVEIIDGKLPIHSVEQVHIQDGRALFSGKVYEALSLAEEAA